MCPGCHGVPPPARPARRRRARASRRRPGCRRPTAPPVAAGSSRTHPADLQDADAGRVAQGGRPRCGVTGGGPEPLGHHGDAHDDVADRHHGEVAGGEGAVDPGGEDQDPDDLDEGQEAVEQVVDVVGRGEPGEVDPGPPDGEEHQQVADDRRVEVARPEGGVELVRRLGHRHHERQVEEELERGRGPVLLVDVPRAHRVHPQATARHVVRRRVAHSPGGRHGRSIAASLAGSGEPGPERTKPPRAKAQRGFREKSRRRPTLPGGLPPSTIGAGGLNCRVRNGNGCFPAAMATGNLALSGARPPDLRAGPRLRLRFRSP